MAFEKTEKKGVGVDGGHFVRVECGLGKMAQIRGEDRGRAAMNRRRSHMAIIHIRQCDQFDAMFVPDDNGVGKMTVHQLASALYERAGQIGTVAQQRCRPFILNPRGPVSVKHAEQGDAQEQIT